MRSPLSILLLLPACLLLSRTGAAQNLVPNPGFEQYRQLPCSWLVSNLAEYADDWSSPTSSTPDLMSDLVDRECYAHCLSTNEASHGTQKPHSGHNMVMITIYGGGGCDFPNYREYVSVKLDEALIPGKKYYAEMYISLTDHSGFAANNIGMCFFENQPEHDNDCVLRGEPQVNMMQIVDADKTWVKVSGTFVADKNYSYLAIGNFFDGADTQVQERPASVLNPHYEYWSHQSAQYFVDDILVRRASDLVVTGDSLVPVNTNAVLTASGCKTYDWADASEPGRIIFHGAQLTVPMPVQRTFIVYSDCDTTEKTVGVLLPEQKPEPVKPFNGRKVRQGKVVPIAHPQITITLYDNNKEDGDSVSLYYGDSCLVKDLLLTKKKQTFTLTLDTANQKPLVLYAENQGSIPPNTAGVTIIDGRRKTNLVLSSDLKTCDSVTLAFKEED